MPTHHFISPFLIEAVLLAAAIVKAQTGHDIARVIARAGNSNLTKGDLQKEEGGKPLQAGYEY
jgi:hypothetical protein